MVLPRLATIGGSLRRTPETRVFTPIFGILNGTNEGAGAVLRTPSRVAKRRWRSLAMASYTQLSFTEQVKRCTVCGMVQPLSAFHRQRSARDGHKSRCKSCQCAEVRAYQAKNRAALVERRRIRRLERRDEINAQKRAYRAANLERVREQERRRERKRTQEDRETNRRRALAWYYANHERARATRSAYYHKHRDEILAKQRVWRAVNRDRILARKRAAWPSYQERNAERLQVYREANRERIAKRVREYSRKHPERAKFHYYARKARMKGRADTETVKFTAMLRRDTCSYCGGSAGTIDHIVPLAKGGKHHWSNLTAACMSCNNHKKTMSVLTFLHRHNRRDGR